MNSTSFALSSSSSPPRRIAAYNTRRIHHAHQTSVENILKQQQQQQQQSGCRNKLKSLFPMNSADDAAIANKLDEHHQKMMMNQQRRSSSMTASMTGNQPQTQLPQSTQEQNKFKFKSNPLQYITYCILDLIHKAFEKEEKVDELESMINDICGGQEFIYRKQQEIDVVCKQTSFNKNEVKLLYWGWKLACPEGVLNEQIFKEIYAQFFPQAGDSSLYARYVFQAMFAESLMKQEPITFMEYAKALSILCRGTMMDKIKWIFMLYDINRDGRITYDEVYKISVAIYLLLGFHVRPSHNLRTYEEHAKRVFGKLDQNQLGYVLFDQFKEICLKDENIINSMQQLDIHSI